MTPILEARNLSSRIERQGISLIRSFSFSLHQQERLVLTGPSGVGKSVLLRTIAFLEPLKEGEIYFYGKKLSQEEIPQFRSRVIYLAQKPSLSEDTVEDNFKRVFAFKSHKEKKYSRDQVLGFLKQFNLSESFLDQQAKLLSGGEAQILALIRALILKPSVLLLDEPTASLDSFRIEAFENGVLDWVNSSQDRSLIWVTHQKEQKSRLGTRVLTLG
jgi:putative ABC transport system ATP-binding protein